LHINNGYTALTRITTNILNPNRPYGIMIEEVPSDIGRSYEGYKRGGIIEGAEKLRRELMGAAVWLGGIPAFKFLGDKLFEKLFHVPMKVDFSNVEEGNNAIGDTLEYIFNNKKADDVDVSGIAKKYADKFARFASLHPEKFKKLADGNIDVADLVKKVSKGKKITASIAVILNCLMMGVVLPKINQAITRKKLQSQKREKYSPKFASMKEFQKNSKTDKNISFTGFFGELANDFRRNGFAYTLGYRTENDNTFRLLSTDIPMIIGRVGTSRNKYEGFENFFMDATSIFFYNFCSGMVQKGLRKMSASNNKMAIPEIKPMVSETISKLEPDILKEAFKKLNEGEDVRTISDIFDKNTASKIYKAGTFGKYGLINKFVKNSELQEINKSVFDFMEFVKKAQSDSEPLFKDSSVNTGLIKKIASQVNKTNAGFLGAGLLASIIGLSIIVPKTTFLITKLITGRNEFTGIANYDDDKTKKA